MSIFDYDDGDFLIEMSDNMAMDSGDIHITSGWNRNNDDEE